jgi:predicted esterase
MKIHLIESFLAILCLLVISCSNSGHKKSSDENNQQIVFQQGKIVEKIQCRSNPNYSYAYYLPKSFSTNRKYPLIIIFDAHARAKMALNRFEEASDNYEYIIVASNDMRNGIQDINPIINAVWDDVVNRFPIDQSRIYTAGFSGGARIAASVAIYKGGVKGVIACGAGMPSPGQGIAKKFDYISIVGLNDLNYQELKTLDKALTDNEYVSQMLTFEGTHEWPDSKTISNAVAWLDLMAMKQKSIAVDDKLVRDYTKWYADTINNLIMKGENYQAYLDYNILLKDLDGLYDISDYKKSYNALLQNPQIEQYKSINEKLTKEELDKQQQILEWFKSSAFSSIKNEALRVQKLANSSNQLQVHHAKRLLGFMGMLSFLYTESSLNSQNQANYSGFMAIYELLEPKNPDIQFFKACQATMDNQAEKAMGYIQKAIDFGFYDVNRMQNIGYFDQLRTKPEFDILVSKARENFNKLK